MLRTISARSLRRGAISFIEQAFCDYHRVDERVFLVLFFSLISVSPAACEREAGAYVYNINERGGGKKCKKEI